MTGRADLRLGITDVAPVVSCGSFSARAVVGRARADHRHRVPRGPRRRRRERRVDRARRRRPVARSSGWRSSATEPDRWLATVVPDREGRWTFRVEAWSDPLATWHHAVEVKVEAGQGAEDLANDLEEGARLLDRVAAEADRRARGRGQRRRGGAARHLAGADRPHRAGVRRRRCRRTCTSTRCASWSPARRATRCGSTGRGRSTAPGTSSSRAPRAPSSAAKPDARHVRQRRGPAAGDRRHGLRRRLPAADPPDRHGQPQGPELTQFPAATRRVGRTTSARRGRSAAPRAGTTPSTRSWARWRTSGPSSPAPASSAWRWRWTSRCRPRPDHPWVEEHPEWFTTKPDGTIAYAENPPKKYQDIYPINFDNDPEGIYAECLRVIRRLDRRRASRSSASTTRTPSR